MDPPQRYQERTRGIIKTALPVCHEVITRDRRVSRQTEDVQPMLVQSWATVCDAGPTLYQHRVNVSCFLGSLKPRSQIASNPPLSAVLK